MKDQELLQLAAGAAGFGLPGTDDHDEINRQYEYHLGLWVKYPWGWDWFRPHLDDGQALRLAVKLNIEFACFDREQQTNAGVWTPDSKPFDCMTPYNGDKQAAVRRAIVRAAAAIQQSKEAA